MKEGASPEDIYGITLIDDPVISPGGGRLCYCRTVPSAEEPHYPRELVVLDRATGEETTLSSGEGVSSPLWLDDGENLAFLGRESGRNQIWILHLATGEKRRITSLRRGVESFIAGPGGTDFFFRSSILEGEPEERIFSEPADGETARERKEGENSPVHVTGMIYRFEGVGYLDGTLPQIFSVDSLTGECKKVSGPFLDYRELSLSPDGRKLAATSLCEEERDWKPQEKILWLMDTHSGKWIRAGERDFEITIPRWSRDSHSLFFAGHRSEYGWSTVLRLYEYSIGADRFTPLGPPDLEIGDSGISDIRGGAANPGLVPSPDGTGLYFLMSRDGNTGIARLDLISGGVSWPVEGDRQVYGFSLDGSGGRILYAATDPLMPNDLFLSEEGRVIRLTHVNREYLSRRELSMPETFTVESFDGLTIRGWVMKPAGMVEGKTYPSILEIHGGPSLMFSRGYMHEFQYLCSRGFAVVFANPRGSSGRGQEFMGKICRAEGGRGPKDFRDLMAVADYAASLPYVDENRMGVTGGSYGGFMTNWVVGHTDRFRAALTQRSISDWKSFRGTADYGFVDPLLAHQSDYFDEEYLDYVSPLSYVKEMATPLCILHSENDYRCPLGQAQQLYAALKALGKETEMYIFPRSGHGLSRNGIPALRIKRLEIIASWFERRLGDAR